jgi:hypothetical protein
MFRRLRIAVSMFFALLAVAFAALWVRCHYRYDRLIITVSTDHALEFRSENAECTCEFRGYRPSEFPGLAILDSKSADSSAPWLSANFGMNFGWRRIWMPTWFAMLTCIVVVAVTRTEQTHFSLRTMLIATTLIAVMLGLAVWVAN